MKFSHSDQIDFLKNKVIHKSAGGFVFYESPNDYKLYVALLQKPDGGYFIPKGHIQKNENPESAALREIKEELSLKTKPRIVTKICTDSYTFNLPNDKRIHYKNVHLYVFSLNEKEPIKPLEKEDFINAEWIEFNEAKNKMAFDKKNLLKARQLLYFHKPFETFNNTKDIRLISIGIPTYNGSKTIYRTLNSITEDLNNLPKDILKEIIICTDHCVDNTEQIVNSFILKNKKEDIEFKFINNNGFKGKSTTLNKIFENTNPNSKILCFIDDDVELENKCILSLINALVNNKKLKCVFAKWVRKSFISKNIWKKLWHWILGIKFDIQPYDRPSEYMLGPCMMLRRENFVRMPDNIFNDDQFLQYIYWPMTKKVNDAIIYFNSVNSLVDYYKRFIRITVGAKQLEDEFTEERIEKCFKELHRKIDYKRIMRLPIKQKLPFILYRFIRLFISSTVKFRLKIKKDYEWFRIKQN